MIGALPLSDKAGHYAVNVVASNDTDHPLAGIMTAFLLSCEQPKVTRSKWCCPMMSAGGISDVIPHPLLWGFC